MIGILVKILVASISILLGNICSCDNNPHALGECNSLATVLRFLKSINFNPEMYSEIIGIISPIFQKEKQFEVHRTSDLFVPTY